MKEIEIVKEFNEKKRHRDGGKIHNAIAKVLDYAEKYFDSINIMNKHHLEYLVNIIIAN